MRLSVVRVAYRLCFLALALFLMGGSVHPQSVSAVTGRWVWKEVARKNKPQKQFSMVIHRQGDLIHGTYSVDEFINGKWQGEDGNQTPFRGRANPSGVEIEFDPSAVVPGYQENVVYTAPTDGRKPSVAVLKVQGGILLWRFSRGDRIEGVPARLSLHRERRRK